MELLQLRYFYESARTESFTKTAQAYLVPTTSVAASVKRLEQELGCRLFDRLGNRIRLNENGRLLMRSLIPAFTALDGAVNALKNREDHREIRMLVRAMRSRITDAIIGFQKTEPGIAFQTIYDFSRTDYSQFDIVIDEKENSSLDYPGFPLFEMNIVLMAAADSPLKGRKLTMAQLADQPFISMGEQSNMHRMLLRACARAGFTPHIAVYSNDSQCHERLVEAGVGIGLARERPDGNGNRKTARLDVADFHEKYTVYAYYQQSADYGVVRKFLDYLKSRAD